MTILKEEDITPDNDGILFINAASKGKTKLGKALSNFAHYPFNHPKHGHFESMEGYWYWLMLDQQYDELRLMYGYDAKKRGDELAKNHPNAGGFTDEDLQDILEGLRCKLRQNKELLNMLVHSTLPFIHFNWYGKNGKYKIYLYQDYQWFIDEIERIRKVCREKWNIK
jgi:hypothetical protein